jgi:RNA-splicing ligase RtcB
MGRYSYVLAGTALAFAETFGSTCHGAGRRMSRAEAKRQVRGRSLLQELEARGVHVMAAGMATVAEEMPEAYKDVADVVGVVDGRRAEPDGWRNCDRWASSKAERFRDRFRPRIPGRPAPFPVL